MVSLRSQKGLSFFPSVVPKLYRTLIECVTTTRVTTPADNVLMVGLKLTD
jgi:hypothetical protein